MSSSSEPDLSGFPILRLDQISIIETDILRSSLEESVEILQSYEDSGGEKPKIAAYLQKQVQNVRNELTKRAASERILAMLDGVVDPLQALSSTSTSSLSSSSYYPINIPAIDLPKDIHKSGPKSPRQKGNKSPRKSDSSSIESSKQQKLFTPLPLPSEILLQKRLEESSGGGGGSGASNDRASSAGETVTRIRDISEFGVLGGGGGGTSSDGGRPPRRPRSGIDSAPPPISREDDINDDGNDDGNGDDDIDIVAEAFPGHVSSKKKKEGRRSNNISHNVPVNTKDYEKKAMAVVNENFGSQFVVMGVEKKKRFFPQKTEKQKEIEREEAKEKEKETRRQVAMKRLMDRRQQRSEDNEKNKKARALTKQFKKSDNDASVDAEKPSKPTKEDIAKRYSGLNRKNNKPAKGPGGGRSSTPSPAVDDLDEESESESISGASDSGNDDNLTKEGGEEDDDGLVINAVTNEVGTADAVNAAANKAVGRETKSQYFFNLDGSTNTRTLEDEEGGGERGVGGEGKTQISGTTNVVLGSDVNQVDFTDFDRNNNSSSSSSRSPPGDLQSDLKDISSRSRAAAVAVAAADSMHNSRGRIGGEFGEVENDSEKGSATGRQKSSSNYNNNLDSAKTDVSKKTKSKKPAPGAPPVAAPILFELPIADHQDSGLGSKGNKSGDKVSKSSKSLQKAKQKGSDIGEELSKGKGKVENPSINAPVVVDHQYPLKSDAAETVPTLSLSASSSALRSERMGKKYQINGEEGGGEEQLPILDTSVNKGDHPVSYLNSSKSSNKINTVSSDYINTDSNGISSDNKSEARSNVRSRGKEFNHFQSGDESLDNSPRPVEDESDDLGSERPPTPKLIKSASGAITIALGGSGSTPLLPVTIMSSEMIREPTGTPIDVTAISSATNIFTENSVVKAEEDMTAQLTIKNKSAFDTIRQMKMKKELEAKEQEAAKNIVIESVFDQEDSEEDSKEDSNSNAFASNSNSKSKSSLDADDSRPQSNHQKNSINESAADNSDSNVIESALSSSSAKFGKQLFSTNNNSNKKNAKHIKLQHSPAKHLSKNANKTRSGSSESDDNDEGDGEGEGGDGDDSPRGRDTSGTVMKQAETATASNFSNSNTSSSSEPKEGPKLGNPTKNKDDKAIISIQEMKVYRPNDSDLIFYKNGMYQSVWNTDELPGLAAWSIDNSNNINNNNETDRFGAHSEGKSALTRWTLDMRTYHNVKKQMERRVEDVVKQHKNAKPSTRKILSLGLVELANKFQSLIRGQGLGDLSESSFRAAWTGLTTKNYDDYCLSEQSVYNEVTVCGNTFSLCRKLELLLKTNCHSSSSLSLKEDEEGNDSDNDNDAGGGVTANKDDLEEKEEEEDNYRNSKRSLPKPVSNVQVEEEDNADNDDDDDDAVMPSYNQSAVLPDYKMMTRPSLDSSRSRQFSNPTSIASSLETEILTEKSMVNSLRGSIKSAVASIDRLDLDTNSLKQSLQPQQQTFKFNSKGDRVSLNYVSDDDENDLDNSGNYVDEDYNKGRGFKDASKGNHDLGRGRGDDDDDDDDDGLTEAMRKLRDRGKQQQQQQQQKRVSSPRRDHSAGGDNKEKLKVQMAFAIVENEMLISSARDTINSLPKKILRDADNIRNPSNVKLTTFYPNIGMIFPMAYSQTGKSNEVYPLRSLLESMKVQCNCYSDWLDVMSDYHTVFGEDTSALKSTSRALHYRVKSPRSEVVNIIVDAFQRPPLNKNWEELPGGLGLGLSWNLLWTWSKPRINHNHLLIWQRVNHFEDSKNLTRKDLLKKSLQRFTDPTVASSSAASGSSSSSAFEIMPQTFVLPHEYTQFVRAFSEIEATRESEGVQNYWIMKPVGLSRGRGISLVRDVSSLTYSQTSVVQRYIEKPLCLDGFKFDLRLYVLVTSFKPLEAFIYRDGFARVSTVAYSLDAGDMSNKFIHLTNSSIQKHNNQTIDKGNPLHESNEDVGGSKVSLLGDRGLWARLNRAGLDTESMWRSICLLVVKSLVAAEEKIVHQPCCFEVFGYDVIIDHTLRPWLLEVNASPSLARENALDNRIKDAMVKDTIQLIDPAPYDREALLAILQRRMSEIAKAANKQGTNAGKTVSSQAQLEADLQAILGDYRPRPVGDKPSNMGQYELLAPNTKYHSIVTKLKNKIIKPSTDK